MLCLDEHRALDYGRNEHRCTCPVCSYMLLTFSMHCVSHCFKLQANYATGPTFCLPSFYLSDVEITLDVLRTWPVIMSGMAVFCWMWFPALDPLTSKAVLSLRSNEALQLMDFLASGGYVVYR